MSDAIETNNRGEGDVWKGLVAGLIGGLVASWTMNRFQDVWVKVSAIGESTSTPSSDTKNRDAEQPTSGDDGEQDDTTVKAAVSPWVHFLRGHEQRGHEQHRFLQ